MKSLRWSSAIAIVLSNLVQVSQSIEASTTTPLFTGQPIFTGNCTIPTSTWSLSPVTYTQTSWYRVTLNNPFTEPTKTNTYSEVLESAYAVTLNYQQQGCAPDRIECCPYSTTAAVTATASASSFSTSSSTATATTTDPPALSSCPPDYYTTDGVCCPTSYILDVSTVLGRKPRPCVIGYHDGSTSSITFSTPHAGGIYDANFNPCGNAYCYDIPILLTSAFPLVKKKPPHLGAGAIAGIAVAGVAAVMVGVGACLLRRRTKKRRAAAAAAKAAEEKAREPKVPEIGRGLDHELDSKPGVKREPPELQSEDVYEVESPAVAVPRYEVGAGEGLERKELEGNAAARYQYDVRGLQAQTGERPQPNVTSDYRYEVTPGRSRELDGDGTQRYELGS